MSLVWFLCSRARLGGGGECIVLPGSPVSGASFKAAGHSGAENAFSKRVPPYATMRPAEHDDRPHLRNEDTVMPALLYSLSLETNRARSVMCGKPRPITLKRPTCASDLLRLHCPIIFLSLIFWFSVWFLSLSSCSRCVSREVANPRKLRMHWFLPLPTPVYCNLRERVRWPVSACNVSELIQHKLSGLRQLIVQEEGKLYLINRANKGAGRVGP